MVLGRLTCHPTLPSRRLPRQLRVRACPQQPAPSPPHRLVSSRCLRTTRLLLCREAASAPTPPSHVHPAFLRIHAQPGCPGTVRPGPRPSPCPAPTHHPKPLAPVANNLCLSGKQHETRKASALSAKPRPQPLCRQPRSLPRSCLCAFVFLFFCFYFQ